MPIVNLTSHILANVYLHEYDFLLFASDKYLAKQFRTLLTKFLAEKLQFSIHAKNNVIISPRSGVRYLGVTLYPFSRTLEGADYKTILDRTNQANLQSCEDYVARYC